MPVADLIQPIRRYFLAKDRLEVVKAAYEAAQLEYQAARQELDDAIELNLRGT